MISVANPALQYRRYKKEIDQAIHRVLDKGWYVLGEEVVAFEEAFAKYIGVSYGIGVGSGTEAIHLALASCGVGSGDEVITVSHTAVATVAAIELTGAIPVFVDIDSDFFTMHPNKIEAVITNRTKAIVPVHIYGQSVDLDSIMSIARKHSLYVIEDCAQAHGAEYKDRCVGSFGDMACFSFYPTKNLGALGDGGMIVTDNTKLAQKSKQLREYGWGKDRFISHRAGWNTRLDELQAAVLRIKLKYLDDDNKIRISIAEAYSRGIDSPSIFLPIIRNNSKHVFHLYVIRVKDRDQFIKFMQQNEIATAVHYPIPVHKQPAYKNLSGDLKQTELIAEQIVTLPLYPGMTVEEINKVIEVVKQYSKYFA